MFSASLPTETPINLGIAVLQLMLRDFKRKTPFPNEPPWTFKQEHDTLTITNTSGLPLSAEDMVGHVEASPEKKSICIHQQMLLDMPSDGAHLVLLSEYLCIDLQIS